MRLKLGLVATTLACFGVFLTSTSSTAVPSADSLAAPKESCALVSQLTIELESASEADSRNLAKELDSELSDPCSLSTRVFTGDSESESRAADNPYQPLKTFTWNSPSFTATDSQGTFDAQVNYGNSNRPVQFGYRIDPYVQAMAISPVTAVGSRSPANCTYGPKVAAADYPFHWSCPTNALHTNYNWTGTYEFTVFMYGGPGTATITTSFNYLITNV